MAINADDLREALTLLERKVKEACDSRRGEWSYNYGGNRFEFGIIEGMRRLAFHVREHLSPPIQASVDGQIVSDFSGSLSDLGKYIDTTIKQFAEMSPKRTQPGDDDRGDSEDLSSAGGMS